MPYPAVPFDSELEQYLQKLPPFEVVVKNSTGSVSGLLADTILHEDHVFTGPDSHELKISVFRRKDSQGPRDQRRPAIYHMHGGGMIMGNRFFTLNWPLRAVEELDVICLTIEYRLAPAHPDPAPIEDCYAGLLWTFDHAQELGIDPNRVLLNGVSAGGGLAAGVALLARDRAGPRLIGQALFAPMLDDRSDTVSAHQFEGLGIWDRNANIEAWTALLEDRRATADVGIYTSPARAEGLGGLPPAYIDVGSAETFRDEDVGYALKLWQSGVQCELHVWPGGFHGFDAIAPHAQLSVVSGKSRMDWLRRLLKQHSGHC